VTNFGVGEYPSNINLFSELKLMLLNIIGNDRNKHSNKLVNIDQASKYLRIIKHKN
jgi:hypothetical protein